MAKQFNASPGWAGNQVASGTWSPQRCPAPAGEGTHRAQAVYRFQLYIAGHTPNSAQALANLRALCENHFEGRYEIEVIDVFSEPIRARDEQIAMTPTLLKLAPGPVQRIVGTLADLEAELLASH